MAKSASYMQRHKTGGSAKGSLTLANGERIEFDGELKFGRDSGVSGAAREQIEKWENKRRSNKIEFAYAVTQQGEALGETRGGKKGVGLTKQMKETENSIVTHIHPRGNGELGGVFSQADMVSWTRNNMKTMRAVSKEGTYSISKQSNFNSKGFLEMFSEDDNKRRAEYTQRGNKIVSDYKAGKITREAAVKGVSKEFNTYLLGAHQNLIENQKKYGYTYGLEKT